ncbi:50S ribosomal protein L18e [Methanobacterium alkalithermotolerans]|uniref:Large ribosomal subunit protein eL18 n=1 Tax=Methanobacterium alkalithermotolerans TaxID=2731220 RepID=A0A8T8K7D4_9EURY|nr:50S ribosomal protein L18e [Methanobacterium alkalithermotolerans]QUH23937.1 50S ribosomal protein L18e [Methanobacterium alkalithermotolerans]RJS49073.1 MAG: 50S ribosomal protein L18e [Methanobacterium sp.]
MVRKITKTNPNIIELIINLRKQSNQEQAAIWKDLAKRLERSNRRRAQVNLSKISRNSSVDETILIPGKVLGSGNLDHKVQVVALGFSKMAQEKIKEAGGECLDIATILEENPKGSNIRIIE